MPRLSASLSLRCHRCGPRAHHLMLPKLINPPFLPGLGRSMEGRNGDPGYWWRRRAGGRVSAMGLTHKPKNRNFLLRLLEQVEPPGPRGSIKT